MYQILITWEIVDRGGSEWSSLKLLRRDNRKCVFALPSPSSSSSLTSHHGDRPFSPPRLKIFFPLRRLLRPRSLTKSPYDCHSRPIEVRISNFQIRPRIVGSTTCDGKGLSRFEQGPLAHYWLLPTASQSQRPSYVVCRSPLCRRRRRHKLTYGHFLIGRPSVRPLGPLCPFVVFLK